MILTVGLVAGVAVLTATALAQNNWLLYLPAILGGKGGDGPSTTKESNKWLLFLPAILAGSKGEGTVTITGGLNDTGITDDVAGVKGDDAEYGRDADDTKNDSADGHAGFSFVVLTGGCIQDNVTGLMWTPDQGEAKWNELTPEDTLVTELVDNANNASFCGKTDWRVPTIKELVSIVDYHTTTGPTVDTTFFADMAEKWYWTETDDVAPGSTRKWGVNFSAGKGQAGLVSTSNLDVQKLRLVRDIETTN
jgi:hypothetical protein